MRSFLRQAALLIAGAAAGAQPAARPHFEVASIKRSDDCSASGSIYGVPLSPSPGRLTLHCATVSGLILGAYGRYADGRTSFSLPPALVGGPSWIQSERYSINAEAASDENRAMMNGPMLQTLLKDRFQLRIHHETRQVSAFILTAGKNQTKLKPFTEGSCVAVDFAQAPPPRAPGQPPPCQNRIRSRGANLRTIDVPAATITAFSELLGVVLGRPVIDRTGIPGKFDFHLEFGIDQSTPGFVSDAAADPAKAVSIFTAVREQLGLRLESGKGPGDFLVIDRVVRPSEN